MDLSTARAQIAQLDAAFQAELAVLPADTWSQPSDCAGWTIAAAVIHCAQVAELLGDGIRRGRAGDPGPPPLAATEGVQARGGGPPAPLASRKRSADHRPRSWPGTARLRR
jgi:hypothetical protein